MVGRYYHLEATGALEETLDREVSLKSFGSVVARSTYLLLSPLRRTDGIR